MDCRLSRLFATVVFVAAWGSQLGFAQPCTGLCLQQVTCPAGVTSTTSVSGTVYAPNGTDPLPNVLVYVPNAALAPMPSGVSCSVSASGSPLVWTTSNSDGTFVLTNMPVGTDIPLGDPGGQMAAAGVAAECVCLRRYVVDLRANPPAQEQERRRYSAHGDSDQLRRCA